MPDIFAPLIQNLISFGFYNLLIWMLALAIMYAILKKSKILGESPFINGVVALAIAFFIFAFPVLTGVSLTLPTAAFFTQTTVILLFFIVGFIMASLFYPDLPKFLIEQFTRRTTLWALVALGIGLFITSGLVGTFWFGIAPTQGAGGVPTDIIIIVTGVILFIVVLMIAASIAAGRE
ncbi:MAG: hypothetical protein QMD12_03345 [Candidatus Aenigmarchaeota archaeon]|nr:hypothetical protein [Candidatus Aenigmarchaeota archaeon]